MAWSPDGLTVAFFTHARNVFAAAVDGTNVYAKLVNPVARWLRRESQNSGTSVSNWRTDVRRQRFPGRREASLLHLRRIPKNYPDCSDEATNAADPTRPISTTLR